MTETPQTDSNNIAIASLVLGILSLLGMGPLTGIPAIITGFMGLKNPVNKGMALAGLIMGGISTAFAVLIFLAVLLFIALGIFSAAMVLDPGDYDSYINPADPAPYQQRA